MAVTKFVVILAVAAFDLAIVARGIRTNEFVTNAELWIALPNPPNEIKVIGSEPVQWHRRLDCSAIDLIVPSQRAFQKYMYERLLLHLREARTPLFLTLFHQRLTNPHFLCCNTHER